MHRPRRLLGAGCAVLLAATSTTFAAAGTPGARGQFVAGGDRITPEGAVVRTFRSDTATITVIGRRGSSVSFHPAPPTSRNSGTLRMSMSTTRPKTAKDATAYGDSGRSVIGDLVTLGMPRDEATREFGELGVLAGATSSLPPSGEAPTPYDAQCASIKVAGGKITGYGCATFFLVHRDGADWWLTTKMKVSARSSDESWFSPKRLTQLGWRVTWGAGNTLYDWDPYNTHPVGSCVTLTVKSSSPFADVSVQGNICPESLGPWAVTTARSGGIWNGMEHGTDWEGALATQAVHSPPGTMLSYQSAWTLSYCDLWCN